MKKTLNNYDFVYTQNATFEVDLQPGSYDVTLQLGDTRPYSHSGMQVYLQGQLETSTPISTSSGQVTSVTFHQITVGSDHKLLMQLMDYSDYVVMESMVIGPGTAGSPPPPPPPPPTSAQFDFGTAASPVGSGYAQVTDTTTYSASQGYGWTTGSLASYDTGIGTAVTEDFVYTHDATFEADMAAGSYDVTLQLGDPRPYAHSGMQVYIQGQLVTATPISTSGGQVTSVTFHQVTVGSDNKLLVRLTDGSDFVVMESMTIGAGTGQPPPPPPPPPTSAQFDFGTSSSAVASGYIQATDATTYTSAQEYGWTTGSVQSYDTGIGTALTEDFIYTHDATFEVDLAAGSYDVTLQLGDTRNYAHSGMQVYLQGNLVIATPISTEASQVTSITFHQITVGSDNKLLMRLTDGSDYVVMESMVVGAGTAPPPPPAAQYDFGTASSPVGSGYTQVTEQTAYNSTQGYGWTSGVVASYDTGIGSAVAEDFIYTKDATFEADESAGTYSITLQLGDTRNYAHPGMQIYIQGQLVTATPISTAGGQVTSVTFTGITVGSNGKLLVRLVDSPDYVVLESLVVNAGT